MPSNPIPQVTNNFLTTMNMPYGAAGMPNYSMDSPSDILQFQMQIYNTGDMMMSPATSPPLNFASPLSTDIFTPMAGASPLQTSTMGLPTDSTYGELMNFATSIDQQLGSVLNTPLNLDTASTSTTPTPPAMPGGSTSQSVFTAAPAATGPVSQEQQTIIKNAEQYLDFNTNNASQRQRINNEIWQGNPNSEGWCAQFVAAALRETYGSKSPLGSSWDQGVIYGNPGAPYRPKGQMPQPGDVVHLNGAKDSNGWTCGNLHVAIVTKVYPDGSFDTIEGGLTSNGGTGVYAKHYNADTLKNPNVGFQDVADLMASKSG